MVRLLCAVCFFVLLALPLSSVSAARHAFVVGIDRYDNLSAGKQLQKAVNDARAMARVFDRLRYDVISGENVSRRQFNRLWSRFLSRLSPGDEVAVYFSGHGVEIGGANFLIPRDVPKLEEGESELLKDESISFDRLLNALRRKRPRVSFLVLDACRNNPFADSRGRSIGGSRGLGRVEPSEGTFVMYSAGVGQRALDRLSNRDKNPNSVYTRTLLPLLKKPGLSLADIARSVRKKVRQTANLVHHKQTPAYYDQMIGKFCPAGCALGVGRKDIDVVPTPGPTSVAVPRSDPAARAWRNISASNSCAVLKTFIRRHQSSEYADYARARRDELNCGRQPVSRPAPVASHTAREPQINARVISAGIDDDPDGFVRSYRVRLALKIKNLSDQPIGIAIYDRGKGSTFMGLHGERCNDGNRSDAVTGIESMWNSRRGKITPQSARGRSTRLGVGAEALAHVSLECSGPFRSNTGSLLILGYIVLPDRIISTTITVEDVKVR